MIITSQNFIKEAKKIPGFTVKKSTIRGVLTWFITTELKTEHNQDINFILHGTNFIEITSDNILPDMAYMNTNCFLDHIYHLQLEKNNSLNLPVLTKEIETRMSLEYYNSAFLFGINNYSGKDKKGYIKMNNFPVFYCPILERYDLISNKIIVYIDGKRTNISKNAIDILLGKYHAETIDRKMHFWDKETMPFYGVSGRGLISLFQIINLDIVECECGALLDNSSSEEICQICYPGITIHSIFQQYSAKAEREFSFKSVEKERNPLYLGVELELENRTNTNLISTWKVLKDHAIIKRDGSVTNGIEICSAPATYESHKTEFKSFFNIVKNSGLEAKDNCGMHIHVDKTSLSQLQIGKMLSFLYNKENVTLINKIAGRKDNSYCTLSHDRTITSGVYFDNSLSGAYGKKLVRQQSEGRYTGLNLSPSSTIEFRIFASTISYDIFLKNLEFVQSIVDFTKPSAISVKSLKDYTRGEVYLNFINQNKKMYPNLSLFLKSELQGCN